MNKVLKGLLIQLGADTSGIEKALRNVESDSRKTSSELKEINKAMKNNGDSAVLWAQKQKVLEDALDKAKEKLRLLQNAEEDVRKSLQNGSISAEQYRTFERELENARSEVNRLGSELQQTSSHAENLGSELQQSGEQAQNAADNGFSVLSDTLGNLVTQGIGKAASALADFTKDVVETGKGFESSLSSVKAISNATAEEMELITQKSEELGATTKFTAQESADAFGYMALAGWNVNEMLSGIDGVLDLAAASGMQLGRASDIVTDELTAFGLAASDSAHFVDMMTYAMSNSNTTTELLGEAYKNCASTAASLGYSAEDVTAVLMTMANAGKKGGEAGTALNAVMTRLATDTKDCASILEDYDVHVYDSKGNMQSLSSILQGISGIWSDLNDKQQANLAKAIAGTTQYSAFQTIMNGLSESAIAGGKSFTDYAKALEECDGTAQNMSKTMIDNLSGDMTLLDSAVDGMKISLSNELMPVVRDAVQFLTSKIPDIQQELAPVFKKGAEFVAGLIKQLPNITDKLSDIYPALKNVIFLITASKVADSLAKTANTIKTVTSASASAAAGIGKLGMLLNAVPAAAAVAAFALIAGAVVNIALSAKDADDELTKIFEDHEKEMKALNEDEQQIKNMKNTVDDSISSIKTSTERTKDLWNELDKLADSSGKVHSADKVRAEYILGELNDALGTEYTMTGNQIDNYKQLQEEIDKTIQKKQAEQILDSYYAQTAGMSEKYYKARQDYLEKDKAYQEAEEAREEARKKYREITGFDYRNVSAEAYINASSQNSATNPDDLIRDLSGRHVYKYVTNEGLEAANELLKATELAGFTLDERQTAFGNFKESAKFMEKQSELMTEYSKGNYENVAKLAFDVSSIDQSIFEDVNATNDEIETAVKDSLNEIKSEMKLWRETGDSGTAADILDKMGTALNAAQTRGMNGASYFNEYLGSDFRELWKNGGDISAIAQRLMDSGISAGDILGDEYISAVQSQFEHGYNIVPLLQWGAKSGKLTAANYNKEWNKAIEKELSDPEKHIDASGFTEWAEKNGKGAGTLFGENFSTYLDSYLNEKLWKTNDLIQATINSLGDLQHKGYEVTSNIQRINTESAINTAVDAITDIISGGLFKNTRKMADGGTLRSGQAVVAEAGPELLEIINGGVRVTPLSQNSRNSPVSANNQKLFYNNYTINATVSGNTDISRLAEQLAREQRRIEAGKGL